MSEVKENKGFVTAEVLKKVAQDAKQIKNKSYELMRLNTDSGYSMLAVRAESEFKRQGHGSIWSRQVLNLFRVDIELS